MRNKTGIIDDFELPDAEMNHMEKRAIELYKKSLVKTMESK